MAYAKSKAKKPVASNEVKVDIYEKITNRIVEQLEQGKLPWTMPWGNGSIASSPSRPLRANGEPYSGVNIVQLWMAAEDNMYASPYWMTFKQAQDLGGQVRKGEKATHVVYASTFTKEEQQDNGDKIEKTIPFMKSYCVFNADQIDGLPDKYYAVTEQISEDDRINHADEFFRNTKATIKHGGNEASYTITTDVIRMPNFKVFKSQNDYYATLAHETTHWTRHPSRLDRDFGRKRFGDEGYAMEELVAELGASFLCADLGLEAVPSEKHAAYIQSWITVLKNDKRAIFTAASHASKAVEYMHSLQPSDAE